MYKRILIRISILLLMLVVFNFIYAQWFYKADIQKHSPIINLVKDIPHDADIIYIGESSNTTSRADDIDKRSISALIANFYPKLNTYDITKPASHAGIFKVLLQHLPKENTVETLVVTLNLRSFNAQWIYSNLETPLQKSLVLLKPYPPLFNRFLLSFKAYDIKSEHEREHQFKKKWKHDSYHLPFDFQFHNLREWDAHMWKYGITDAHGNKNQALTELACHYIKAYGFQIDTTRNPRIKDFDEIVELARKRGWQLMFNLLAENTQKAKELVGDELIYMLEENAKLLVNYYQHKGVIVVNNLHAVDDEQFIDQNWTTEHYAEKGRKTIAQNVAKALKTWHAKDYKEIDYSKNYQNAFFNDCEHKKTHWTQTQTINEEVAFSGNKSSQTGAGNDFSIVMTYPLKAIPDSTKTHIKIAFMINQTSLHHDAKLVVQANGSSFNQYWKAFSIKDKVKAKNKWIKYNTSFSIADSIKQAESLKVYILNTSETKIYIDDFRIEIE